jgi:hypothetical protein
VAAPPNSEIIYRPGYVHLIEKNIGHIGIVVLARMHDEFLNIRALFFKGPGDYGCFNKLGAGTDYCHDFH